MIHLILKTMETTTGSIAVGLVFFLIILVLMSSAFWRAIRIILGKFIGFVVEFPEKLTDEERTLKVMKMYTPNNGVPKEYKPDSYKMNSSSYIKACTKCSSTLRVNGKCLNCEY